MDALTNLIKFLLCIFPRPRVVAPNEGGVRIFFGKWVQTLKPGWYWFWPIFNLIDILVLEITSQVKDVRAQSVITKDGRSLAVGVGIEYSIKDARKALLCVQDFDKSLQDYILGLVLEFINERTFEECKAAKNIKGEVLKRVRDHVTDWGLKIKSVFITDLTEHTVYRILSEDSQRSLIIRPSTNGE